MIEEHNDHLAMTRALCGAVAAKFITVTEDKSNQMSTPQAVRVVVGELDTTTK